MASLLERSFACSILWAPNITATAVVDSRGRNIGHFSRNSGATFRYAVRLSSEHFSTAVPQKADVVLHRGERQLRAIRVLNALQQTSTLFDDVVGNGLKRKRHGEASRRESLTGKDIGWSLLGRSRHAARADATLLETRSMAKSVELGMTMSGARRVR
jgi:hypothetical protein